MVRTLATGADAAEERLRHAEHDRAGKPSTPTAYRPTANPTVARHLVDLHGISAGR